LDSLTQVVLGASVAAVCVPQVAKRKAAVIGAVLGTLPDLDVLINYGDAVANFTYHRGFSHSLFVLFPFAILLWALLKKTYQPVKDAPMPWFFAITLALITHPLLDAHTAYGTQLFWPMTSPPISWSTIFIIDPLYTLPLLIGTLLILIKPDKTWASRTLISGIVISTGYLAWTWSAKLAVDNHVQASLENPASAIFSTPTAFNSLLWRVVVLHDDHYQQGFYSLLQPAKPIQFESFDLNKALLNQTQNLAAVQRLTWFTHGFIKTTIIDDHVVISDLRMGTEGNYVFSHAVAKIEHPHISEIESLLLPYNINPADLSFIWDTLTQKH